MCHPCKMWLHPKKIIISEFIIRWVFMLVFKEALDKHYIVHYHNFSYENVHNISLYMYCCNFCHQRSNETWNWCPCECWVFHILSRNEIKRQICFLHWHQTLMLRILKGNRIINVSFKRTNFLQLKIIFIRHICFSYNTFDLHPIKTARNAFNS